MGNLKIIFLSVGNGDSIFMEYIDDAGEFHFGLIDCNDIGRFKPTQTFLKRYFELKDHELKALKRKKILESKHPFIFDFILVSHSHADHTNGIKDMIRNFGTKQLFHFKYNKWGGQAPLIQSLKKGFRTNTWYQKIAHEVPLVAGDEPVLFENSSGIVKCEVIWPFDGEKSSKENNNSLMILIHYGRFKFLFGGDAEQKVWNDERIKSKINQLEKIHILKVPHHGAKNGFLNTRGDFIAPELAAKTEYAIVSSHIWRYKHPSTRVIQELESHSTNVLRTEVDQNQNIEFNSDGESLSLKCFTEFQAHYIN